jgi:hypothetical protein
MIAKNWFFWLTGGLCTLIGIVGIGAYILSKPVFLNPVLASILGIVGLQVLLASPYLQRFWLELDLIALILFGVAVYAASPFPPPYPASLFPAPYPSKSPNLCMAPTPTPTPTPIPTINGCFLLPADKIQTNLKNFQPQINDDISLLIVVNNEVHTYDVTIADTAGIGNDTPNPPYSNDLLKIVVQLNDKDESRVTDFAKDLVNAKAIFLLPTILLTPTPTAKLFSPTFVLPFNKLQLNCPAKGRISEVILVTSDHKAYSYQASVQASVGVKPIQSICPTPPKLSNNISVTITLPGVTAEVAATFAGQLSNATTIYLV